jgi:type I restriction enzyme, S subunit
MTMHKPLTKSMHERPLPNGWRWVMLKEVIQEAQAGFACGERDTEGIVQLRMNNLDTRGNFVWDDVLRVPKEGNNIAPFLLQPGDVLFNNTNSTELVGKSALFSGYTEPIVYSNHFTRLRTVSDALLPDFLASWLNHQWQHGVFAAICNRWIGQSAVKADKLLNLEIPLPPLQEQRRIAAILKEQMAAVEKARAAAQARLEAVKALPAAFLRQVFPQPGQPLPNGWRWVKLGEVCQFVGGSQPPKGNFKYEPTSGYVRLVQIQDFRLSDVAVFIPEQMALRTFDITDVMIGRYGPPVFQILRGLSGAYNVALMKTVPSEKLDKGFLYFVLQWPEIQRDVIAQSQRSAGQSGVQKEYLEKYSIPLPSIDQQRSLAAQLNDQMASVEKARAAAEAELTAVNALPAALLRRAFAGKL